MSDQNGTDDPTVPDDQLPKADRDKIRATAKALIDHTLRMDSDEYTSLPPRVRRRAWERYQRANEDDEPTREKNSRVAAEYYNGYARRRARERQGQEARRGTDMG